MSKILKLSIITPNYNYAHYIEKTIQSVVDQDYDNWEHIIVDDGSTDNSIEVISGYVKKFPGKIRLIKQENKGQTKAINIGLKLATGDIIGWINSDDYYHKKVCSRIIDCFNQNPEFDAVYGDIGIIDEHDKIIKINKYLNFDYASGVFNGFGKIIPSNAIFWRKELTTQVGLLDERYQYAMDSEYWSRLLYKRNVKKIKLVVAYFRWHPQAKTILRKNKKNRDYYAANTENIEIMKKSYENLKISKIISFKYSKPIFFLYRMKRYIFRGLLGQYFI